MQPSTIALFLDIVWIGFEGGSTIALQKTVHSSLCRFGDHGTSEHSCQSRMITCRGGGAQCRARRVVIRLINEFNSKTFTDGVGWCLNKIFRATYDNYRRIDFMIDFKCIVWKISLYIDILLRRPRFDLFKGFTSSLVSLQMDSDLHWWSHLELQF